MSYNYDLEVILEENKIKSALSSLVQWFKDKIKLVKEKIDKLVSKFKGGKNLPPEKKSVFQKVKTSASDVINNCKKGISACKQGASEKAKACKDKVMSGINNMSTGVKILAGVGAVAGGVAIGKKIKGSSEPSEEPTKKRRKDGMSPARFARHEEPKKKRRKTNAEPVMFIDKDKSKWDDKYLTHVSNRIGQNYSRSDSNLSINKNINKRAGKRLSKYLNHMNKEVVPELTKRELAKKELKGENNNEL